MKAWLILLAGVAVAGCGGSVDSDPNGSGAAGGSGGSSGAGAAGGMGGNGAFGGSGAVSGSSGTAGSGAVAGTAGSGSTGGAPACCTYDLDCPQYFDDGDDPGAPLTTECVEGVCKTIPYDGSCWEHDDCPYGACQGASVCPCEWDCIVEDTPGWCALPPEPYCCQTDFDCGDFMYVPCVANVCKQPVPGACWKDDECFDGKKCVGANVCPCGAFCAIADTPGKCV